MTNLPEEAIDKSTALISMNINLNYSKTFLTSQFLKILEAIQSTEEIINEKNEVDAQLKQLAIARLYRIFRSVTQAESYLARKGNTRPYIHKSGWSTGRKAIRQMIGANVNVRDRSKPATKGRN